MRLIIAALAAAFTLTAIVSGQSSPECNRACLTGFADTFVKALTANTPAAVPLATNAEVTFNGRVVKLADACWDSADHIV